MVRKMRNSAGSTLVAKYLWDTERKGKLLPGVVGSGSRKNLLGSGLGWCLPLLHTGYPKVTLMEATVPSCRQPVLSDQGFKPSSCPSLLPPLSPFTDGTPALWSEGLPSPKFFSPLSFISTSPQYIFHISNSILAPPSWRTHPDTPGLSYLPWALAVLSFSWLRFLEPQLAYPVVCSSQ